ncbi:MAG: PH domain-containing protein [Microbacterium sp.]
MSEPPVDGLPGGGSSTLADGGWHRMHPLTPLFRGGLVLVVIFGFVIGQLRDRLVQLGISLFAPDGGDYDQGDPLSLILDNHLVVLALLVTLGVVIVIIVVFYLVWRFAQFRITGDHVEVRRGILFRSHRRAPLDRVQGVNLTRPFVARLFGLAKLEVVGAGNDANVLLEYLGTKRAESVRSDILRLASGARAAKEAAVQGTEGGFRQQIIEGLNEGVAGLVEGVDLDDVEPESVVKIPTGRLVASTFVLHVVWFGIAVIALIVVLVIVAIAVMDGHGEAAAAVGGIGFGAGIPLTIGFVSAVWGQLSKSMRYSIAPTRDGVRITFGLTTTVTETIPPGRIFAVEVSQPLLWRPFGWWAVKINRMSGQSRDQQQGNKSQQFNTVLPVGTRADVERILGLILPDAPAEDVPAIWQHGILGPTDGDPYRTMARRAWWRRPVSWRREGYLVTSFGLLLRRGRIWRRLAVFPLARVQGASVAQSPVNRWQRTAWAQVHTVSGPVAGQVHGLDRDDAMAFMQQVSAGAVRAASVDRTHRWSA